MISSTPKYHHQAPDVAAPNIGVTLKSYLKARGLNQAELGRRTNRSTTTVHAHMKRKSMQTAILWEMCHALKHNFFADLAGQLPEDYKSEAQSRLAAENAELKLRVSMLEDLLRKGRL